MQNQAQSIYIQYVKTNFGELLLADFEGNLCVCDWQFRKMRASIDQKIQKYCNATYLERETPLHIEVKKQLNEYFDKQRTTFDLPLLLIGTDFQKEVWENLQKIPYGQTDSYMGLAKKMQNTLAIRAIASANGANTLAIIIPCHRIIGSNGDLVGYAGGLSTKKKLLQLENNSQTNLFE